MRACLLPHRRRGLGGSCRRVRGCRPRDGDGLPFNCRGHDGGEAEVGVLPGVLADVSTLAVELDLNRVHAVQDDDPGLLDDEALVDERFNPRRLPGELVAELVQECTK